MELDMRKNLSNTDRAIRVVIGLILFGLTFSPYVTGWWAVAAFVLAVSQFLEASISY